MGEVRLSDHIWFRISFDVLHDLSAGVGPGAVLALWMVHKGAATTLDPAALATMVTSWAWILLVLFTALVVLVVTGSVRLSYWNATIRPDAEKTRGRSALIKHVVFVGVFVYVTVVAFGLLQ